tara:strand:+ start:3542 stop:4828 length:1287 start_codon:yes stop_codon:yes gene_type:complete
MNKIDKIKEYLLKNPSKLRKDYAETAIMFNTNYEVIRGTARRLRKEIGDTQNQKEKEVINIEEQDDNLKVYVENSNRVKSIEDLIKHCKIDLNEWEINKYDIGTYEVTGFNKDNHPTTVTMYRMKAWLTRIKPELNLQLISEQLREDLKDLSPKVERKKRDRTDRKDMYLLEISAFDLHLGKIGVKGDDYSLEIAETRLFDAIDHLLYRAQGYNIDKILFIIGNDFLNSDGDWPIPSTTKGTPQFNSNYHIDIYRSGRKMLIKAIEYLTEVSPVHVMVVPGNHDRESMMHLGDTVQLYFENNDNVYVDNGDCLMKMMVYGKNMVIADHGDGPKIQNLPAIISQRYKNAWSDVDFVEVHRGHLHTNKAAKLAAIEELSGITVRNLSSMSATDYWHDSKGFIGNIKKAQAFLYHRKNGLQCIMNYNVDIN